MPFFAVQYQFSFQCHFFSVQCHCLPLKYPFPIQCLLLCASFVFVLFFKCYFFLFSAILRHLPRPICSPGTVATLKPAGRSLAAVVPRHWLEFVFLADLEPRRSVIKLKSFPIERQSYFLICYLSGIPISRLPTVWTQFQGCTEGYSSAPSFTIVGGLFSTTQFAVSSPSPLQCTHNTFTPTCKRCTTSHSPFGCLNGLFPNRICAHRRHHCTSESRVAFVPRSKP